ncbi:MAG: hypothetical protein JKY93_12920 [Gammaproteobacteria bacterium]|nr:hypothetical protein [Gammaproteobacteria bacterium]
MPNNISIPQSLTNLLLFDNHDVRVAVDANGDPWFCAKDVCDILDIVNVAQTASLLDEDELCSTDSVGRKQEMIVVSESGFYGLTFKSRKPEAKKFRKWVASEVLSVIRKQVFYGVISQRGQVQMTNLVMKLVSLVQKTSDAFAIDILTRRLRNLCNLLGEPMPSLNLIGQDLKQLGMDI